MNRKSNNKQTEELLQETFSNLHVGQYSLFLNFITKQNTTEMRIIVIVTSTELHF